MLRTGWLGGTAPAQPTAPDLSPLPLSLSQATDAPPGTVPSLCPTCVHTYKQRLGRRGHVPVAGLGFKIHPHGDSGACPSAGSRRDPAALGQREEPRSGPWHPPPL